ncbi:hypothetical protein TSST111916_01705 [Tsukamurella strandjordii]|uniref:hypothetical protein n=1 Tax=Tsukamurella TaxID=2060 RepID=UPI001C7CD8CE|nr:hypothetical protein [Tsukamurella sp. TY48]
MNRKFWSVAVAVAVAIGGSGLASAEPSPSPTPKPPVADQPITVAPGVTISPKELEEARNRTTTVYVENLTGKSVADTRRALRIGVRTPALLDGNPPIRLRVLPKYPGSEQVNPAAVPPEDLVVVTSVVYRGTLELAVVPRSAVPQVRYLAEAVEASRSVPLDVQLTMADDKYSAAYFALYRAAGEGYRPLYDAVGIRFDARGVPQIPEGMVVGIAVEKN